MCRSNLVPELVLLSGRQKFDMTLEVEILTENLERLRLQNSHSSIQLSVSAGAFKVPGLTPELASRNAIQSVFKKADPGIFHEEANAGQDFINVRVGIEIETLNVANIF